MVAFGAVFVDTFDDAFVELEALVPIPSLQQSILFDAFDILHAAASPSLQWSAPVVLALSIVHDVLAFAVDFFSVAVPPAKAERANKVVKVRTKNKRTFIVDLLKIDIE